MLSARDEIQKLFDSGATLTAIKIHGILRERSHEVSEDNVSLTIGSLLKEGLIEVCGTKNSRNVYRKKTKRKEQD
jgi:hypothetical protein